MAQVVDAFANEVYNAKKNVIQDRLTGQQTDGQSNIIPPVTPTNTSDVWKDTGWAKLEAGMGSVPKENTVPTETKDSVVTNTNTGENVLTPEQIKANAVNAMNALIAGAKQAQDASNAQYLKDITEKGEAYATSARNARDKAIQSKLTLDLQAQEENKTNAENQFTSNSESINQNTYNTMENQKTLGAQRGIQYSQQQQALEQGVQIAGNKSIEQARTTRDQSLNNIKSKIDALKSSAESDLGASASQAEADKAQYGMQAIDKIYSNNTSFNNTALGMQGQTLNNNQTIEGNLLNTKYQGDIQMKVQDNANAYDWKKTQFGAEHDKEMAGVDEATKIKLANLAQTHDKEMASIGFENSVKLANLDEKQKENFFKLTSVHDTEMAKLTSKLDFDSKVKLANVDANIQKEYFKLTANHDKEMAQIGFDDQMALAELNNKWQAKITGMSLANQMSIAKMSNATQVSLFNMDTDRQKALMGMEQTNKEKFLNLSTDAQKSIMDKEAGINRDDFDYKTQVAVAQQAKDGLSKYIENNPAFNLYPELKTTLFGLAKTNTLDKTQVGLLNQWFDSKGMTADQKMALMKGSISDSKYWTGANSVVPINNLIDIVSSSEKDPVKAKAMRNRLKAEWTEGVKNATPFGDLLFNKK